MRSELEYESGEMITAFVDNEVASHFASERIAGLILNNITAHREYVIQCCAKKAVCCCLKWHKTPNALKHKIFLRIRRFH